MQKILQKYLAIKDDKSIEEAYNEIVVKLTAIAEKMTAEIGGSAPAARRPAGKVENPKTLYPAEPRKPGATGKKK